MYLNNATEMSFLPKYTVYHLRQKLVVIIGPSFSLGTSSMTSLFVKNFWFAQTAVEKIQQIPDCCVRVGKHSGCCAESCTKLLLLDFFCQRFVDSFWECPLFICLSLLTSSIVFVVPLFCVGSSFPSENQTMPLRLCSLYACIVIGTSFS